MSFIQFYLSNGKDTFGRTFQDMLDMTNEQLEDSHDVVQFLFPLNEKSSHLDSAPVVSLDEFAQLRCSAGHNRFQQALLRFMAFYRMAFKDGKLVPGVNFEKYAHGWITPKNHNFKRITRIIRCAVLLNLPKAAEKISTGFIALVDHPLGKSIGSETIAFWQDAVTVPLDGQLNFKVHRS